MAEDYKAAIERIRKIPEDLAREQIARDPRSLSARIANDVERLMEDRPQSQSWAEAWQRLRLELKEIDALGELCFQLANPVCPKCGRVQ